MMTICPLFFQNYHLENKKFTLIGDFNMNVLNCENISSHAEFLDICD